MGEAEFLVHRKYGVMVSTLENPKRRLKVEIDGEQAERVLQMVLVLGSLLVTKLLFNVQRGENED